MRNFSNLNTSSNSASLSEIFLTNVLLHDPVSLCKVFKILAEANKVFNLHKFLINVFPKFNWKLICAMQLLFISLDRESKPKCLQWYIF